MNENVSIDWKHLSEADRVVLKSLGIIEPTVKKDTVKKPANPITLERRLSTRNTCPAEYYIKMVQICSCCHAKTKHYGHMRRRNTSDNYLSLCEMQGEVLELIEFKKSVQITPTCPSCYDILGAKTHEQLIEMVIKLSNSRN